MRTVEEHLAVVLAAVHPARPARVPIGAALGLVTVEDVRSLVDLPGFDNSAMDGYAVRAADVAGAGTAVGRETDSVTGIPVTLAVVGEVAAGGVASRAVGPGEAVRIMTGAMVPEGADAVVKVEDTDGGTDVVQIRAGVPAGTSLRWRGEDVHTGDLVLPAGSVVDARRVALLAATGHGDVLVTPRPRVAVVSTGAELVQPGESLQPGQIHESNSHMLVAAFAEDGVVDVRRDTVDDDPATVLALIEALAEQVDLIVTTGGVSMGAYDVVKESLADHGVDFVQVSMQPGKPQGFGVVGSRGVPIVTLPGNPVSSYVSYEVFVRPALRTLMGLTPVRRPAVRGRLAQDIASPRGRTQIARAVACRTDSGWLADPVWGQASHFVADLARANAFVVVPPEVTSLAAGDEVELWLLGGAERSEAPAASSSSPTVAPGSLTVAPPAAAAPLTDSPSLTHVRADGSAHMVDVSAKAVTAREASAAGRVLLSPAAVAALRDGTVPKGDALAVARIAGLQAVKRTPDLIPLAHPVAVHAASVDLEVVADGVDITATVRTADRTGIEMEALTAVSVAALALIDMVKAVDKHARVTDVRVTAKSGGRSGDWTEP